MKIDSADFKFIVLGLLLIITLSCKKENPKVLPTITTTPLEKTDFNSATIGGNITADGGSTVVASGICWSLDPYPTIEDNSLNTTPVTLKGTYAINITGLKPSTNYYVRAFATNSVGTVYGNVVLFSTNPLTMTDPDGNIYHTVTIGTQIWTVENLKTTKYKDGSSIANVTDDYQWYHLTTGGFVYYGNDKTNKTPYGALYNWFAVNDPRGLAPAGWHIPTDAEWTTLINYLFGERLAAGKLCEKGTIHWIDPQTEITNETGFTALPSGYHTEYQNCYNLGYSAYFWTATEDNPWFGWSRAILSRYNVYRLANTKQMGLAVRCIKDN